MSSNDADELLQRLTADGAPQWDTPEDLGRMSIEAFAEKHGGALPSVAEMYGSGPDFTGGVDSSEYVRSLREQRGPGAAMTDVRIFIPHHDGDDVKPDGFVHVELPAVPRVGDTVIHSAVVHPVEAVAWDVTGGRVTVYLGDPMGAVIAGTRVNEDRESFHARGDARDVMPTGDPDVRASILESARELVARWMPELPWFRKPGDARVEDEEQRG